MTAEKRALRASCADTSESVTGPKIGSLCSGIGGLELGLMAVVGGSVAWHVEYDKHPAAVLEARFPGVPNYGDVTTTDWTRVEPVDWLTAGYPCQPFSHAGKRKGSADERHLWPAVADAIGVLRPRRVLLENVAGHVSLGLDAVLADLATLGYDATWGVVRASDAGACHRRERIFISAADASRDECGQRPGVVGVVAGSEAARAREGTQREWHGDPARDSGAAAPDASGGPLSRAAPARDGLRLPAERGDDAAPDADELRSQGLRRVVAIGCEPDGRGRADIAWGDYEPAIRRWEFVTGRPAPMPTEAGRTGERLSPRFVEWMQGLDVGWVTSVLPRNPALKALGNCVVPQQAALAVRTLLSVEARAA